MRDKHGLLSFALLICAFAHGADYEEVRVKRKDVFEFTEKPAVSRSGDQITIRFTAKDYCDASVAIEDHSGRMVRHLGSGVLGKNAPAPFRKDSLAQEVVWDGKDDQGRYVDAKDEMVVRVSLGLKPRFERNLFWSPYKRHAAVTPFIKPAPEGVYVFESRGNNTLRLYDHDGNYLRTVHPPPADKIEGLQGIEWIDSPQTGARQPVLRGFVQCRFLTSSEHIWNADVTHHGDPVYAATGVAVHGKRIALGYLTLNRLATDGTTGGLPLSGPQIGVKKLKSNWYFDPDVTVGPSSMAFSPDGKTLYLAGYMWNFAQNRSGATEAFLHGVRRMDFESGEEAKNFLGEMSLEGDGSDTAHFSGPTSVACDAAGRIYVSDYMNDRIQIFAPEGTYLKTLPVPKPAKLAVHPETGEIVVFSWTLASIGQRIQVKFNLLNRLGEIKPTWTQLGTFEKPLPARPQPLPVAPPPPGGFGFRVGQPYEVAYDFWAKEPTLWFCDPRTQIREDVTMHNSGLNADVDSTGAQWQSGGVRVYKLRDGKWTLTCDFNKLAAERVHRLRPAAFHDQRLIVNPATGKLYLLEHRGHLQLKSNHELLELDPASGKVTPYVLPMAAEDVAFDLEGHGYLRDDRVVVRFDPATGREIPWDYGEEFKSVGMADKHMAVLGALVTPSRMPACGHQEGMFVSTSQNFVVSCFNLNVAIKFNFGKSYTPGNDYKPYTPPVYPGRVRYQELHVFDKHGQPICKDAFPGLAHVSGVALDEDGYMYVQAAGARVYDGKSPFNPWSCTLIKVKPGKGRVEASTDKIAEIDGVQVPLAPAHYPKRSHDLEAGIYKKAWVDGAEWFYGGVGFSGQCQDGAGGKSLGLTWDDWYSRFAFDGFARSFLHELDNYSIAVVDKSGNLIMRFGRYGNEQDGRPLVEDEGVATHAIGGPEVALLRPTTLATQSDRRLFVTDAGNARILSIKLGYETSERIPLAEVPDQSPPAP